MGGYPAGIWYGDMCCGMPSFIGRGGWPYPGGDAESEAENLGTDDGSEAYPFIMGIGICGYRISV